MMPPNRFTARLVPLLSLGGLLCLLLCGSRCHAQTPAHDLQAAAHRVRAAKLEAKSDYQGAIQEYQKAYVLDKSSRPTDAALDLECIGINHVQLNQYDPQSLPFFQQALAIRRRLKDRKGEAATLDRLGVVFNNLARYETDPRRKEAVVCFLRAMTLAPGELSYVLHLSFVYTLTGDYPKTLALLQTRLRFFPAPDDQKQLEIALADMHYRQAESLAAEQLYVEAIPHYDAALAIDGQLRPSNVPFDWMGEGDAYDALSEYDHAIGAYLHADIEATAGHNKQAEAGACDRIADIYEFLGNHTQSRKFFQQAYDANLEVLAGLSKDDSSAKSSLLSNLGLLACKLGKNDTALDYLFQASAIIRKMRDLGTEQVILNNLAVILRNSDLNTKAVLFIQQALSIARQLGDNVGEVTLLSNTGVTYDRIGQFTQAISYYRQALIRAQSKKNTALEASVLGRQALTHEHLGNYSQALSDYQQALRIETQFKQTDQQAATLGHMMRVCQVTRKTGLAVLYGKQAVNTYQTIRAGLLTLDKETQKDYAASVQQTYRGLADLLISQGRLPEAEAVLALLKNTEYRQFNGADRALAAQLNAPVPFTADEAQWQADYAALGDTLEHLSRQATVLAQVETRTPAQETQYRALTAKLDKADAAFQAFQGTLVKHFTDAAKGNAVTATVAQNPKLMNALVRWSQAGIRVAALYTVEADTEYAVILVTPSGSRPGATAITAAGLNAKIEAFRQALTDPRVDPRPLGQELYRILVGPVEKDLNDYAPQVVMWSLDGQIRYLPVAALHDGRQYLVERWQNTLFDPASLSDLDQGRTDWSKAQALGLGVSQEHHVKTATQDDQFSALTHVPDELNGIIRDPAQPGVSGVLPGQVRLDAGFTRQATLDALRGHTHPVVHIATHFRFDAARAEQSYLLLGDGGQISLADLRRPGLFQGVDLLTLSACSTAMGQANADGKEVDSLGRTAEDAGAQAVIASLWSVSDDSTARLMQTLYRTLEQSPATTKAAALQAAQLSLLRGTPLPGSPAPAPPGGVPGRGTALDNSPHDGDGQAPAFVPDPKAPYAHPFYWAPFVLIGNWR